MISESVKWLEARLGEEVSRGVSQSSISDFIYGCYAIYLHSGNLTPLMFLIDALSRDYSLWIYVSLDLPLKDPQAFLYLYEFLQDVNPEYARKLNSIGGDLSSLMLPNGRFPGIHEKLLYLALRLYGLEDVRFKPAIKYFRDRILKVETLNLEEKLWVLRVASMLKDLKLFKIEVASRIIEEQDGEGSWGRDLNLTINIVEGLIEGGISFKHSSIGKALKWVMEKKLENNSWENSILLTSRILILYRKTPSSIRRTRILTSSTTPSITEYISNTMLGTGSELIIENPPLTEEFKNIIKALKRIGVEIRILLDPLFMNVNPSMEEDINYLRSIGVNVRFSEYAKTSLVITDGEKLLLIPSIHREDMLREGIVGIAVEDAENVEYAKREFLKIWEKAKEELTIPEWIKRARTVNT
ncbi:MAG: hypothetical protein QXP91_11595 [Candidatus Methanomethylicia archaeon]